MKKINSGKRRRTRKGKKKKIRKEISARKGSPHRLSSLQQIMDLQNRPTPVSPSLCSLKIIIPMPLVETK
jgi:hypothetical protein